MSSTTPLLVAGAEPASPGMTWQAAVATSADQRDAQERGAQPAGDARGKGLARIGTGAFNCERH